MFALQSVTLPSPSSLSHKGSYGHVGVVEGAAGMRGASQLSALAALRAGAGRVTLLGEGAERIPELMATDLHSADLHSAAGVDVVVIGPGWVGLLPPALLLWRARGVKVVADAGALDVLVAGQADVWTPHAGEAGRVLGCSASEVQGDRMAAARALVERLGGVVVLKGAQPVVSSSSRTVIVRGRVPALAVAGSGDVLAGVIGALLAGAQGVCSIDDAVVAAVWLHQEAGRGLNRGALASEIADAVAKVIARA